MTDIASLNIRINSLEAERARRDLDRLNDAGRRTENQMGAMSKAAARLGVALAAATAAGAGFVYLAKSVLDSTNEIQRNANMVGISTKAYQELIFAASQYGITQDGMTDGIKELTLRFHEFATTGAGEGAEAFKALGFQNKDMNKLLKDTPGLLQEVIKSMEGLGQAAKMRWADEIFGGVGGEQFMAMINAGADALGNMAKQAHKLGMVMSDDLIDNAVEAKREIDVLLVY